MHIDKSRRVFAALYHSYVDTSSGAAVCLREMLERLAGRGWQVRVLSGPMLDFEEPKTNQQLLKEQGIAFNTYRTSSQGQEIELCLFRQGGVDAALWIPREPQERPSQGVGELWLKTYREVLDTWRPEVVVTYGGFWMTRPMLRWARERGVRTVFYLCNYAYTDPTLFADVDTTIVLSRYHAEWCRRQLGIEGVPVYPLIEPSRVLCPRDPERRFVTLVNPQPHKGVYVFARIAEVLGRERADIPLLVVESRAASRWLAATGAELSGHRGLYRMQNTPDPRDYYRVTHVALVPSVWEESFGRVAAEAMMNGIPVIGSTRGALPEVIGDAGLLLDIPARITPTSRELPTAEEVRPWVEAIVQLWDDGSYYEQVSDRCRARAALWSPERVVEQFEGAIGG